MVKRIRRKLLSFVDTQAELNNAKRRMKRKGAKFLKVKKELGAYALYGKIKPIMKRGCKN